MKFTWVCACVGYGMRSFTDALNSAFGPEPNLWWAAVAAVACIGFVVGAVGAARLKREWF
jgi:hypothetical protein